MGPTAAGGLDVQFLRQPVGALMLRSCKSNRGVVRASCRQLSSSGGFGSYQSSVQEYTDNIIIYAPCPFMASVDRVAIIGPPSSGWSAAWTVDAREREFD